MRKKLKNKIFNIIFALLFLTANAGLCEQTRSAVMQNTFVKFGLAMGGVILSAIIIFFGLKLYKKFFMNGKNSNIIKNEILKTPKTAEEAIKFFINKNRLGFGAIDLLIGLVITIVVFLIGMNAIKGVSSLKLNGSPVNSDSVQEHVDQTVSDIEKMRMQTINYNKQMLQNNEN